MHGILQPRIIRFPHSDRIQKEVRNWRMLNVSLPANCASSLSPLSPPVTLLTWIYFLFESQSRWLLDILPAVTISKLLNSWPSFVLKWFSSEAQWYICREYWMAPRSPRTREWVLLTTFSKTCVQLAARTRLEWRLLRMLMAHWHGALYSLGSRLGEEVCWASRPCHKTAQRPASCHSSPHFLSCHPWASTYL